MRRWLLLLSLFAFCCRAEITLTRDLVTPEQMVPGQPARIVVTFWTDSWFNPPPEWPDMPIEQGMLLTREVPNELVSRNQEGVNWSGIRMQREVMAWGDGTLRFPAMDITLQAAGQPPHTVHLPELVKAVAWPAGVQQPDRFLPASALQLDQKWTIYRAAEDNQLHVGDVIEREVRLQAKDVIAAQIPPLLFAIAGRSEQKLPPVTQPLTARRDEVVGVMRVERLRYITDHAGALTLPPVRLRWWDTSHHQWQQQELPGASYQIAPPRAGGDENTLRGSTGDDGWQLAYRLAAILLLLLMLWLLRHPLWRGLRFFGHQLSGRWRATPLPDLIPHERTKP